MSFTEYAKGQELLDAVAEAAPGIESFTEWWEACLLVDHWYRARKVLRDEWAKMLDGKKPVADRIFDDMVMTAADFSLEPTAGELAVGELHREATRERITAPTMYYDREYNVITIGSYDVDLDDCDRVEKVTDWIHHLTGKPWFTPRMAGDFTYLLKSCGTLRKAMNREWAKRDAA